MHIGCPAPWTIGGTRGTGARLAELAAVRQAGRNQLVINQLGRGVRLVLACGIADYRNLAVPMWYNRTNEPHNEPHNRGVVWYRRIARDCT